MTHTVWPIPKLKNSSKEKNASFNNRMRTIAMFSIMRNLPRLLSKHKFVEIMFRNSQNKYDLNGLTVYSLDERLRYGVQLLDSCVNFTDFNSTARGRTQCIRNRRKIWSRFSVYWSTLCAQHSTIII